MAAYSFILGSTLVWLLGYHMRIIARGVTTAEAMKARYPNGNPHDDGCSRNCAVVWCGPHWPSRVVEEGAAGEDLHQNGLFHGSRGLGDAPQPIFPASTAGQEVTFVDSHSLESMMFSPTTPRDATPPMGVAQVRVSPTLGGHNIPPPIAEDADGEAAAEAAGFAGN